MKHRLIIEYDAKTQALRESFLGEPDPENTNRPVQHREEVKRAVRYKLRENRIHAWYTALWEYADNVYRED